MEVLGQSVSRAVRRRDWIPISLAPHGPTVSHIFFTDDLLLCGEVSFSQARTVEYILADFCHLSGQWVNRTKSRLWFSPNTPRFMRNLICSTFGISPTSDLGTYLGVPIIHGRVHLHHYQYLLDKAARRLESEVTLQGRTGCSLEDHFGGSSHVYHAIGLNSEVDNRAAGSIVLAIFLGPCQREPETSYSRLGGTLSPSEVRWAGLS